MTDPLKFPHYATLVYSVADRTLPIVEKHEANYIDSYSTTKSSDAHQSLV